MKSRFLKSAFSSLVVFFIASCSPPSPPAKKSTVLATTLCELSRHPERYHGKLIEIRARIEPSRHIIALQDIRCFRESLTLDFDIENPKLRNLSLATEENLHGGWDIENKLLVATLVGTLRRSTERDYAARPVFEATLARDLTIKSGKVCPYTVAPRSPEQKPGEPKRSLEDSLRDDPCSPWNWMRTHPGYRE